MSMMFGKLPLVCASVMLAITGAKPLYGQFNSGPTAPPPAPVSQAFTDGFMDGHRTMAMNLGYGKASGKPRASTGKGDLVDASQELKDIATFVDANWDKADDGGRGKVAGEIEAAVMTDQSYAAQLAKNTGAVIPNHSTESGYYSAPGRINGDKAHAVKLLNDTAAELDTINGGLAGDKEKNKLGEFVDNHAIVDVLPGGAIVRTERRGEATKAGAPIQGANQIANSIKVASDNLANILMPGSAGPPAAK